MISHQPVNDVDVVLFGGTGDLVMRKLLPALYALHAAGHLSARTRIFGIDRHSLAEPSYASLVGELARPHIDPESFNTGCWLSFVDRLHYLSLDATLPDAYSALCAALGPEPCATRVFYLATPPSLITPVCRHLANAGLVTPESRIVLEKPFGHDLASARKINAEIGEVFSESQIFRIDHYLGKEAVQNLLALRFGNVLFEPVWRRDWISDVQITIAEDLGVGSRTGYYERAGAMRDMLQNHLLQLLCIVAMEPPVSVTANAVRDEKLKVLNSLKRLTPESIAHHVVAGQYRSGRVHGAEVPGYRNEPGADSNSRTETFVAIRAEIDTWRWAGVPFFLRTGKRLPARQAEIVVRFKAVPHSIFPQGANAFQANCLVLRLQPDEGLHLHLMAKMPGDGVRLKPVELGLDFRERFKMARMDAYARLLLDVLRGQLTLFMRSDELEAAWEWVEPILRYWESSELAPLPYAAGTWGPAAASALIGTSGLTWREEVLAG